MRLEDIHIGDVLQVRDWDDMIAEYGEDPDGDISFLSCSCATHFVKPMRYLCGKVFTVKSISIYGMLNSVEGVELATNPLNPMGFNWSITAEMLEPCLPVLPEPEEDYTAIDLSEFLN